MKQLNLPFLVPISRHMSKSEIKEAQLKQYSDIIHAKNEDHFYSQLENLRKAISGG